MRAALGAAVAALYLAASAGLRRDDDWVDHTDMLRYDPTSQSMRRGGPAEEPSGGTAGDASSCSQSNDLRTRLRGGQHPVATALLKRFLTKLLKATEDLGLPGASEEHVHCDVEMKLSVQAVKEIRRFLSREECTVTGVLDEALGQMLLNVKRHDREAWSWRFEDTFGVELSTVLGVCAIFLMIITGICSEMWSRVSWFAQTVRIVAIILLISPAWNWLYLYKTAFAEHQSKIFRTNNVGEKCSGAKHFDWRDNLKQFFRESLTLQDDPCEEYYKALIVDPILLVPPSKALIMTITAVFTDPMKQIGQGVSEFLTALLKNLPITLQAIVLIVITLSATVFIVVFVYVAVPATIQHAFAWPPPAVPQPQAPHLPRAEERNLAAGNEPIPAPLPGEEGRMAEAHRRHGRRVKSLGPLAASRRNRSADETESEEEGDQRRQGRDSERRSTHAGPLRSDLEGSHPDQGPGAPPPDDPADRTASSLDTCEKSYSDPIPETGEGIMSGGV
ncbi:chloride channel CLIC-like protein 1 isoform X2 [Denticeps clupeoides]|uniref:chloride channel CLIC-like protein 1 isoform X2 n=1 Tax=Denticeps clupeoides TaxID=299321 RepID=UPI0010A2CC5C|nr:chloride channel CLIC-like protein 1 isoform X2 [Denticeps clupeoides]